MKKKIEQSVLPVLPLRDMVIFPGAISPIFAGRPMSLAALDAAKITDTIFVLTQKEPGTNKPVENDLYTVGVVAKVLQRIALDDGTVKLLVNGLYRAKVESMTDTGDYLQAMVTPIATTNNDNESQMEAWKHALNTAFSNFASVNNAIPKGMTQNIRNKANFEEALDNLANDWLEESVYMIEEKAGILNMVALLAIGAVIAWAVMGTFDMQDQITSGMG